MEPIEQMELLEPTLTSYLRRMQLNTVLFDMDGLLIDSEPLWQEAGLEALAQFGISLTEEQYDNTKGLRTPEWLEHWFRLYKVSMVHAPEAITFIEDTAREKIRSKGIVMPGVDYILPFFAERNFNIAIASSSPMKLIDVVVEKLNIAHYLKAKVSAEKLPYGKPHPQVFMEAAQQLGVQPTQCIVFEDSFNGMIAAKAAKMKCVMVPAPQEHYKNRWDAADCKLESLADFTEKELEVLGG